MLISLEFSTPPTPLLQRSIYSAQYRAVVQIMIKIACDANFQPTTDTSIETKESLGTVVIQGSFAGMANMSVSLLEYEAEGAEIVHYS
jgi:hypothetical protein